MDEEKSEYRESYGKRPLWQWVLLYAGIAVVVYGIAYYFFFANQGANYMPATSTPSINTTSDTPAQATPQNSNASVAQPVSVAISNFAFNPSQTDVKAGTKVTWTNDDTVPHTVTSNNGVFDSGPISPRSSFSFTFSAPGTYNYHCSFHPSMTATVVVTQ